jgi:hypothetical protein
LKLLPWTKHAAVAADDATTPLERVIIVLISLVVAIAAIAALSGVFAANDQAGVTGATAGPGLTFADLGHGHLSPGATRPPYNSNPPTSGAHVPELVLQDEARLNADQVLQALEVGDVVIFYGGQTPPPGLTNVADSVGGRFTPALAAAGQAVILARRPGTQGLIAVAWTRLVRVSAPDAPLLRQFAQFWLGRGAPGR